MSGVFHDVMELQSQHAQGAAEENPFTASRSIPGVITTTVPDVSHWLMMDDPQGFNRALDAVLVQVP